MKLIDKKEHFVCYEMLKRMRKSFIDATMKG